jgi:hypothetical protein
MGSLNACYPTLRKVREGWGTLHLCLVRKPKDRWGHPPNDTDKPLWLIGYQVSGQTSISFVAHGSASTGKTVYSVTLPRQDGPLYGQRLRLCAGQLGGTAVASPDNVQVYEISIQ